MVKVDKSKDSSSSASATKKKTLFSKIFQSKKNKKKAAAEENKDRRKVEIVVEQIGEQQQQQQQQDARDPDGDVILPTDSILQDLASFEQSPASPSSPARDAAPVEEERQAPETSTTALNTTTVNTVNNSTTNNNNSSWMGGLLENMTAICAPSDQQLPTIMSGEEMDMDYTTDGGGSVVLSPTGTVTSPTGTAFADDGPMTSPNHFATTTTTTTAAAAMVTSNEAPTTKDVAEQKAEQATKTQPEPATNNIAPKSEGSTSAPTVNTKPEMAANQKSKPEPPAGADAGPLVAFAEAPPTPKTPNSSKMMTPKSNKLEPEEDIVQPSVGPAAQPANDPNMELKSVASTSTALVTTNTTTKDDMIQGLAEPSGTKIDIFAGLTGLCCNPVAVPSMDELEQKQQQQQEAKVAVAVQPVQGAKPEPPTAAEEASKGGGLDPDGDKGEDAKSTAQDSQSAAALTEEKKEETPSVASPLPTTPKNHKASSVAAAAAAAAEVVAKKDKKKEETEDDEDQTYTGTIHKEKKNTKMGLSLKNSTMYQGVFIAKIKAGSLFSKTDLREGMQVLEIQGQPCPTALEEAVGMLRHAVGDLTIVAQKPKCEI